MPTLPAPRPRRRRRPPVYRVAGSVDVREHGSELVEARLERLLVRAQDPATVSAAAKPVRAAIARLFATEGHGVWKATRPESTERKVARGQRHEPMRASDRLYQSLVNPHAPGAITRVLGRNTQLKVSSRWPEIVFQARAGRLATHVDAEGRSEVVKAISRELMK
jgi:hypothetical protein